MALLSYFVAEVLLMSGIFAILISSMVMSRYVELNVNSFVLVVVSLSSARLELSFIFLFLFSRADKSSFTINYVLRMLGSTAETFTFLYLGACFLHMCTHELACSFRFLFLGGQRASPFSRSCTRYHPRGQRAQL